MSKVLPKGVSGMTGYDQYFPEDYDDEEVALFANVLRDVFDQHPPDDGIYMFERTCELNPHLSFQLFEVLRGFLGEAFYELYGTGVIMFDKTWERTWCVSDDNVKEEG